MDLPKCPNAVRKVFRTLKKYLSVKKGVGKKTFILERESNLGLLHGRSLGIPLYHVVRYEKKK